MREWEASNARTEGLHMVTLRAAVMVVALLLVSPLQSLAQLGFDFAVDSLRIDGNIFFLDDFNDGSVTAPPTSAFACVGGKVPTESGGFFNLRSADGADLFTDPISGTVFLVKHCILGLQSP